MYAQQNKFRGNEKSLNDRKRNDMSNFLGKISIFFQNYKFNYLPPHSDTL